MATKTPFDQMSRFKDAARELGADEAPETLDRIMGKLDLNKKLDQPVPPKRDEE